MGWIEHPLFMETEEIFSIAREFSKHYQISFEKAIEVVKLALIDRHTDALKDLVNAVNNTYFPEQLDVSLGGDMSLSGGFDVTNFEGRMDNG